MQRRYRLKRSLLYQNTQSKTTSTTSDSVFNAPLRNGEPLAADSFLNNPITVSAATFWDNSQAEIFFSTMKNERVYRTVYATEVLAMHDVIQYTEGFYNYRRRHSALDCRRPNEVHYRYQHPEMEA